jgi:transcriptional regulator with XRE-family HTH domain
MKLRIAEVRERKGWSQGKLSRYSGVARHHISELENGYYMANIKTLCKLKNALGCTLDELVDCGNEENSNDE